MNKAAFAESDSDQDISQSKGIAIIPSNQKQTHTKEVQKAETIAKGHQGSSSSSQLSQSQQSIQEFVSFLQINEIELIASDHINQDYPVISGEATANQTLTSFLSHDQFDVDSYRKLTLKQKFNYINNTANSTNNQADFSLNLYKTISIPQREYMNLRRVLKKQYELSQAQRGVKVNELLLFERKLKELDQLWEEIKGQLQIALKRQKQEEERFQKVVNNKKEEEGKKGEEQQEQEDDSCWDNQGIVDEETQQNVLNQGCKDDNKNNEYGGRIYNMMSSKNSQNRVFLNKRDDVFSKNKQFTHQQQQDQQQQRENSNGNNTSNMEHQYPSLNHRLNINIININNSKNTVRSPSPQQSAARISTENTTNNLPLNRSSKLTGIAVQGSLEKKQFLVRNANERIHKLIQGSPLRVYSPVSRDASPSPQRIPFTNTNNNSNIKSTKESGIHTANNTNSLSRKNTPSNNSNNNSNTLKPNTNDLADQLPPKDQTNSLNRNNFIDKSISQQQPSTKALSAQSQQQQFHDGEPISRQQLFTSSANSARQLPRNNTNNYTTGQAGSQKKRASSPISKEQRANKVFTATKQYQDSS